MTYSYGGKQIFPVVEQYHDLVPYLGGISEKEFFLDAEKAAKAWKSTNEIVADYFKGKLKPKTPGAAPLSYGHLVCLGGSLRIPEDAEPNIRPFADDLDEGIAVLRERKDMDFSDTDIFRHYKMVNEYLQSEFPEEKISITSGLGVEGVITSAELMRGQDFFCDILDDPEKTHEFLGLMNESVIRFTQFRNICNGQPAVNPSGGSLADDFASIIPPALWPEYVVPYWNTYFEGVTSGERRFVHCENTYPEQLKFLKDAKITMYQPSVADRLTLDNIRENTDIPFDWLLYAYRITEMSDEEIQAWVDSAVEAGVTKIRTQFGKYAWSSRKMDRILAFYKAFEKYAEHSGSACGGGA